MNEPLISIVIAAKDAEKSIVKSVQSLLKLDYPAYEIIVVDDGSRDATAALLKRVASSIKIISLGQSQGPSLARNRGVSIAQGDYLAFTDADCLVDPQWLRELLRGFQRGEVVSVGGTQKIPEDESAFGRAVSRFMMKAGFVADYMRPGEKALKEVSHNASCNVMYKKEVFLNEGGFLAGLWPGEDVEFDHRLKKKGYNLIFNPQAVVFHYRPSSFVQFRRMMRAYGYAQGLLVRKYGFFRRIQLVPVACSLLTAAFILKPLFIAPVLLLAFIIAGVYMPDFLLLRLLASALVNWNLGFFSGALGARKI